jgi:type VI secretion system protein ImpK
MLGDQELTDMTKDREYPQDDKTILLDQHGRGPSSIPLTDHAAPPRIEKLEERMIYAARKPAQTFNIGCNYLVAAASGLLSEVVRIKHVTNCEDLADLKKRMGMALEQFTSSALSSGADKSEVSAARYVLCTVVDEAVVTTAWGHESQWAQMSLLSSFHNETFGGEKFFQLLDSLSKNPVKHLPMLELMYLCLALGFEGKYRVQARGILELESLRDALYRQIRLLRGDVPRELSPQWEGLKDQRRNLVRIVPWWTVLLFTGVCLMAMYSSFAWVLGAQRDTVLKPFQQLDPAAIHLQPHHRDT